MRSSTSFIFCRISLAALTLVGCGRSEPSSSTRPPVAPAPPSATPVAAAVQSAKPKSFTEIAQQTLAAFTEAMNAHDATRLAALYAERDPLLMSNGLGLNSARTRGAIVEHYERIFDTLGDFAMAPSRVLMVLPEKVTGERERVLVLQWSFRAKHNGELWGSAATHAKVGAEGADLLWLSDDGQIKEHHTFCDNATIRAQIGPSRSNVPQAPALATRYELVKPGAKASAGLAAVYNFVTEDAIDWRWHVGPFLITESLRSVVGTPEAIRIVEYNDNVATETPEQSGCSEAVCTSRLMQLTTVSSWAYPRPALLSVLGSTQEDHRRTPVDLSSPARDEPRTRELLKPSTGGSSDHERLERLMLDGYSCHRAGMSKPHKNRQSEHCFVCKSDEAMAKCRNNPLTSGCREDKSCK